MQVYSFILWSLHLDGASIYLCIGGGIEPMSGQAVPEIPAVPAKNL
jgi:hypothetical protein